MDKAETFEQAISLSHRALDQIVRGNPELYFDLYSRSDNATLANPYGPPARGFSQIQEAGRRAAANYREARVLAFETISRRETTELAYLVEIERFETKIAGADDITPVALRVTSIFGREDGFWKLLHRHADPITSARSGDSVIQR